MITILKQQMINRDQSAKSNENKNDQWLRNLVLKFLDKGKNVSEINKMKCFLPKKIFEIVKWLKVKKHAIAKPEIYIFYKVINSRKTYISSTLKIPQTKSSPVPQEKSMIIIYLKIYTINKRLVILEFLSKLVRLKRSPFKESKKIIGGESFYR